MKDNELKLKNLKDMSHEEIQNHVNDLNLTINKLRLEVKKATTYGLHWDQTTSPDETLQIIKDKFPLLKHNSDRLIGEGRNLLIEGDNLLVLVWLSVFMAGKINVISIDPPYNTGQGFRYTDIFGNIHDVSEGVPYKGTKWLNMMYPRLFLSLFCLEEDGCIFIHIDEHSRADLELLGKKIFPKFEGEIIWKKNTSKNNVKGLSVNHEHVLIFANKNFEDLILTEKPNYATMMAKLNELINLKGKKIIPPSISSEIINLYPTIKKKDLEKMFPDLIVEMTEEIIQSIFQQWIKKEGITGGEASYNNIDFNKKDLYTSTDLLLQGNGAKFDVIHPITNKVCKVPSRGWGLSLESIKKLTQEGMILYGKDEKTTPRLKNFFSKISKERLKSVLYEPRNGLSDLKELGFDAKIFDYPKPVILIKQYLKAALKPDGLILDFFAGSGTLGQAVIELNLEDGGNRQFILVTNNENKICEEVTYERVKRVLKGTDKYLAKPDKGLAYFYLELVPRHKNTEQFKYDLSVHIIDSLKAIEKTYKESQMGEDIILESDKKMVIWQSGLDSSPIEKLIKNSKKEIVLYLNDFEYSELSEESRTKISRVEVGFLSKIAKSDFSKIM